MADRYGDRAPASSMHDRPSSPLTAAEQATFDELQSRLSEDRDGAPPPRPSARTSHPRWSTSRGVVLFVVGAVWMTGWLATHVAISFAGAVAMAVGMAIVLDRQQRRGRRVLDQLAASLDSPPPGRARRSGGRMPR